MYVSAMLSSADRKIQVGDDFQARVDESQKEHQEPEMSEEDEREHVSEAFGVFLLYIALEQHRFVKVMWRPPGDLDETKLIEFCEDAIGVYKLSYDRVC